MLRFAHVGRYGRRVPLWVRCLALGLAASWAVAMGHWFLIETKTLPRFGDLNPRRPSVYADEFDSGLPVVEALHRAYKRYPQIGDHYVAVGYGWPIRNWGALFIVHGNKPWPSSIAPTIAINVRPIWSEGDLPDPLWRMDTQQVAAQRAAGVYPRTNGTDPYQRYLPVFPLVLPSMIASVIYGVPFFIVFRWRDARRRRGSCVGCGYDLSSLPAATVCPECGKARSVRPAKKAVSPLA